MLLAEFNRGLPVLPIPDLLPPAGWTRYFNPRIGLTFLYPKSWMAQTLWAEQFSPEGSPRWTNNQQPFIPALTTARIFSPAGSASFEAAVGTLHGILLSPLEAATVADLGIAGESSRLAPFCDYEDRSPLAPAWFRASYVDDSVLVSEGFALPNAGAIAPYTIVTYSTMRGPRAAVRIAGARGLLAYPVPVHSRWRGRANTNTNISSVNRSRDVSCSVSSPWSLTSTGRSRVTASSTRQPSTRWPACGPPAAACFSSLAASSMT